MRKLILILWAGILSVFSISCYDDEGSNDYHPINEVKISDWKKGGYTAIFKNDTLKITPLSYLDTVRKEPVIQFTEDSDPSRYEYEWKVVASSLTDDRDKGIVLGTERNLRYFVNLKPDSYTLYLKVKDTKTDLIWKSYTSLTVLSVTDKGFFVLGEKEDGTVGLDMISTAKDTIVLKNLLEGNGLPELRGPMRVMYTGSYYWETPAMKLWISTESGSYYLDLTSFASGPMNTLRSMTYSSFPMPDMLNVVDMAAKQRFTGMSNNRIMMTEDYVFGASLYSDENYGNPSNRMDVMSEKCFRPFPYIFTSISSPSGWIIYNADDHCFTFLSTVTGLSVTQLQDNAGEAFPWIQPAGRTCIYGENTFNTVGGSSNGNSFALMEDQQNFYVYQFYCSIRSWVPSDMPQKRAGYTIDKSKATGLRSGLLYAFASKRSLLLYANGQILHAYDYVNHMHYEKDLGDQITFIKFDPYGNNYDELMVGTYNAAEKGIVTRYLLGTDQDSFELEPLKDCRWNGLVKVKAIQNGNTNYWGAEPVEVTFAIGNAYESVDNETIVVSDHIEVYPTVFTTNVTVTAPSAIKRVELVSYAGVLLKVFNKPESVINLSNFGSGFYLLNVTLEDGTFKSVKLIKK